MPMPLLHKIFIFEENVAPTAVTLARAKACSSLSGGNFCSHSSVSKARLESLMVFLL